MGWLKKMGFGSKNGSNANIVAILTHLRGHWGNRGKGDKGWLVYIVVAGIAIVAFLVLLIFD